MGQLNVLVMFKRVKPTPKEIKETSLRVNNLSIIEVFDRLFSDAIEKGLTVYDMYVMSHLYIHYGLSAKQISEHSNTSMLGIRQCVNKLIGLGYVERSNGYSLILTRKGISYIESFI